MSLILIGYLLALSVRSKNDDYFAKMNLQFEGVVLDIKELGRYDIVHLSKSFSNYDCFEKDSLADHFFCLINESRIDVVCATHYIEVGDTLQCVIDKKHFFLKAKGKSSVDRPYLPLLPSLSKSESFVHPINCD